MRQFYRVYTYDKTTDITSNSVFFHDRENAEAYFEQTAKKAKCRFFNRYDDCEFSMGASGEEMSVFIETLNFED